MSVEPRSIADIVRDLVAMVPEWVSTYSRRWDETTTECPTCEAPEGTYGEDDYRKHKPGCARAALILEAETFVAVEDQLQWESDRAAEPWNKKPTED